MSPVYDFACNSCYKVYEIKMTLAEHDVLKEVMQCEECGRMLSQKVAPLRFDLKGVGWFGKNDSGTGYEVTQRELDKNLKYEADFDDFASKKIQEDRKKGPQY
jgi:predicted nucleic acid-binding Zn ribbon protein